jgi:hypothetical protein
MASVRPSSCSCVSRRAPREEEVRGQSGNQRTARKPKGSRAVQRSSSTTVRERRAEGRATAAECAEGVTVLVVPQTHQPTAQERQRLLVLCVRFPFSDALSGVRPAGPSVVCFPPFSACHRVLAPVSVRPPTLSVLLCSLVCAASVRHRAPFGLLCLAGAKRSQNIREGITRLCCRCHVRALCAVGAGG